MNKNQKGFGAIEAILILIIVAIIGFVGWYVWKQNQKPADKKIATTNQQTNTEENKEAKKPVDAYAGWLSCKDAGIGLTFKYPSDWSTESTTKDNPCGITVPATASSDGAYVHLRSTGKDVATSFKLFYSSASTGGTYNGVDPSYKGETILEVTALNVPGASKPLSLVAYASDVVSKDKVAGLVLTDQTYTVGQKISGSIPFPASKKGGKTINLSASLAKKGNNQSTEYDYTLDDYKKHPDYQAVVNLFKSLSY